MKSKMKQPIPSVETSTSKKSYTVTATVTAESVDEAAKKVAKKNYKEAENARVSKFHPYAKKRFEYTEASQGQKVNETDLANQFKGVFASGASEYRIIADVEKTDAKITIDDLKKTSFFFQHTKPFPPIRKTEQKICVFRSRPATVRLLNPVQLGHSTNAQATQTLNLSATSRQV